jgi:hypothetical protein
MTENFPRHQNHRFRTLKEYQAGSIQNTKTKTNKTPYTYAYDGQIAKIQR